MNIEEENHFIRRDIGKILSTVKLSQQIEEQVGGSKSLVLYKATNFKIMMSFASLSREY